MWYWIFFLFKYAENSKIEKQNCGSLNWKKLFFTYMLYTSRSDKDFVHNIQWNAKYWRQCKCPSKCYAPLRIFIFFAQHIFISKQWKNKNHKQKCGTDVHPAYAPIKSRPLAKHRFNVGGEIINTIKPKYTGRFNKYNE